MFYMGHHKVRFRSVLHCKALDAKLLHSGVISFSPTGASCSREKIALV